MRLPAEREKLIQDFHSSLNPHDCDVCLLLNEVRALRNERDEAREKYAAVVDKYSNAVDRLVERQPDPADLREFARQYKECVVRGYIR
jgi:uncharacterized coiled-coil DUF342 family protein